MRVVGYIRVSRERDEGLSPSTQLDKIRGYCAVHDWVLVDVFRDLDLSGRSADTRPGLQELLTLVDSGEVDAVVVYKLDRLARSTHDFHRLMARLDKVDCRFVSVSQNIDTSTPVGRLLRNILADFAEFESDMIGERIRDNLREHVGTRGRHHGNVPYGFVREKGVLSPHPEESEILRWIFEEYARGKGAHLIARDLNERKIKPPRRGREWSTSAIGRMLRNPAYIGRVTFRGEEADGAHDPLIDLDLWARVQRLADLRSHAPRGPQESSVLGGMLKCGNCGSTGMIYHGKVRPSGEASLRYVCDTRRRRTMEVCSNILVDAPSLERAVVRHILDMIDPDRLREEAKTAQLEVAAPPESSILRGLEERRDTLRRALDRLFSDHYEHNVISREQFATMNQRYLAELSELEAQIKAEQETVEVREIDSANLDLFLAQFDAMRDWETLDRQDRRLILSQVVHKITWRPDTAILEPHFGGQITLDYFEVRRGTAFFDDAHWPRCPHPGCEHRAKTGAGLASHRLATGH